MAAYLAPADPPGSSAEAQRPTRYPLGVVAADTAPGTRPRPPPPCTRPVVAAALCVLPPPPVALYGVRLLWQWRCVFAWAERARPLVISKNRLDLLGQSSVWGALARPKMMEKKAGDGKAKHGVDLIPEALISREKGLLNIVFG